MVDVMRRRAVCVFVLFCLSLIAILCNLSVDVCQLVDAMFLHVALKTYFVQHPVFGLDGRERVWIWADSATSWRWTTVFLDRFCASSANMIPT